MTALRLWDAVFLMQNIVLPACLGWPLTRWLDAERYPERWLLSGVFGYAILTLLASGGYRAGIPFAWLYKASVVAALAVLFTHASHLKHFMSASAVHRSVMGSIIAVALLLVLPFWVGGLHFSLFQSSIWDQFSYTGAAVTFQQLPFETLQPADAYYFVQHPVASLGAIDLFRRPAVSFLYALVGEMDPGQMMRWNYLFEISCVVQLYLVAIFLLRTLTPSSWLKAITIAGALACGFWGQIYVDLDAWSMVAVLPMLMAMVVLLCTLPSFPEAQPVLWGRALGVLGGGALLLYPEATLYHLPAFGLLSLRTFINSSARGRWRHLAFAMQSVILIVGIAFFYVHTLAFVADQVHRVKSNLFNFNIYFNYLSPLLGRSEWLRTALDTSASRYATGDWGTLTLPQVAHSAWALLGPFGALAAGVDVMAGFAGLYFLTPTSLFSLSSCIIRLCILSVFLTIGWGWIQLLRRRVVRSAVFGAVPLWFMLSWTSLLLCGKIFAFSRGYFYFGSYLFLSLFLPWTSGKINGAVRAASVLLVASQLLFGVYRIYGSQLPDRHLANPYTLSEPFDFAHGKADYDFDVSTMDASLHGCREVYVDVPNRWQESAVLIDLYAHRLPFSKKSIVRSSIWAGDVWMFQTPTGHENCEVRVDNANRLQVVPRSRAM